MTDRINRILLSLLLLAGVIVPAAPIPAHEVRPAYLEIDETAPNRFDVLWKQPSSGTLAPHPMPTISNGLLSVSADEEYSANSFVIRRWKARSLERDSFDGATLQIEGLGLSVTDVLVNVSFLGGSRSRRCLPPDPRH